MKGFHWVSARKAMQAEMQAEIDALTHRLAEVQEERETIMDRLQKERRKYSELIENIPRRGNEIATEAIDLLRYSPLFDSTDPAAPSYSRDHVEQGLRRIEAKLKDEN